ncbi:MAG: ankyrin repeat domain-containing protein [Gammaproteobacteria bacterium]|nr:ankyrin repeat domain-containing protein [Gammaproteobacteria bacterium]
MISFYQVKVLWLLSILVIGFNLTQDISASENKLNSYAEELRQIEIDLTKLTQQIRNAYEKKQKGKAQELSLIKNQKQKRRGELKKLQLAEKKAQKQDNKMAKKRQAWEKLPAFHKLCKAISYDQLSWFKEAVEKHAIDLTKKGPASASCAFLVGTAAAANRLDITRYLLENHAPMVSENGFGPPTSALWLAANSKKERTKIMTLLFRYGALVKDGSGQGIGSELISANDKEVQADIEKRRNIKANQLAHGDVLTRIIQKGHINNIRLLLDKGADPDGFNMGRSVLMRAATLLRFDIVELLVKSGANVNLQGPNFETAISQLEHKQVRGDRAIKTKAVILDFLKSHKEKEKTQLKE